MQFRNVQKYIVHKVKETKTVTDIYSQYDTFGKYDLTYEIFDEIKYVTYKGGKYYDDTTNEQIDVVEFIESSEHREVNPDLEKPVNEYFSKEKILYSYPVHVLDYNPVNLPMNIGIDKGKAHNIISKIRGKNKGKVKLSFSKDEALKQIDEFIYKPNNLELPTKKKDTKKYPDDIQNLLEKINVICNSLPNEVKTNILKRKDDLLKEYDENLKELKPKYGNQNNTFGFGFKTIEGLKPELIANLEMIVIGLTSAKNLIDFLAKLNEYKNLFEKDNLEFTSGNNSFSEINNILYCTLFLDKSEKKDFRDKLLKLIDNAIENANFELLGIMDEKGKLSFTKNLDYEQTFKLEVSKLFDEVYGRYKKVKPYKEILYALNSNEADYRLESSLDDLFCSIRFIIENLKSDADKKEANKKLQSIVKKYTDIINNIMGNDDLLSNTQPKKIETNIKSEIRELLNLINYYGYEETYLAEHNKESILEELKYSEDLIKKEAIVSLDDYIKEHAIISYTADILNAILDCPLDDDGIPLIDEENKNLALNDLLNKIKESINMIKNSKITTLDAYNKKVHEILKKLADVDIEVYSQINSTDNYRKNSK